MKYQNCIQVETPLNDIKAKFSVPDDKKVLKILFESLFLGCRGTRGHIWPCCAGIDSLMWNPNYNAFANKCHVGFKPPTWQTKTILMENVNYQGIKFIGKYDK